MRHFDKFLNARLKLRKRHLLEWNALAADQQQVLASINEKTASELSSHNDDTQVSAVLISKRATRLMKLMTRQREEREQMKERHRGEKRLFAQLTGVAE